LAASGLHVVILEKAAALPRYKTCGGGVLGRAVKLLGISDPPIPHRACRRAEFFLSDELHFCVTREQPIVLMTMRDSFDQWLTQKALDAGAQLRINCAVQDVALQRDCVRLSTSQGEVLARFVIAADGASGPIAKKAGWPDRRRLVPALECEVAVSPADFDRFSDAARFDFHPIPHGYAWVFPKESHLSIGVLTHRPSGVNLNDCLARYLEYLRIAPQSVQRHGYVIPLLPRASYFARRRVLLVGDAAGLADPVTAEGITHAIHSGQLAAAAIIGAFGHEQQVCAAYNKSLSRAVISELRWARPWAHLLYNLPRLRDALFRRRGQALAENMTDVVTGQAGYRALSINPLNYLRLLHRG